MNPFQIMNMMRNPQAFIQGMMSNSQAIQNPILKNALQMAQSGNKSGIEQLARNLCKEKGINADDALNGIKNQFGIM